MNQMIAQKRTLIIFSTDPVVMKGADTVISIGTSQGMLVTKNRRQHEQKDVAIKPDEKKAQPTKKKAKQEPHRPPGKHKSSSYKVMLNIK